MKSNLNISSKEKVSTVNQTKDTSTDESMEPHGEKSLNNNNSKNNNNNYKNNVHSLEQQQQKRNNKVDTNNTNTVLNIHLPDPLLLSENTFKIDGDQPDLKSNTDSLNQFEAYFDSIVNQAFVEVNGEGDTNNSNNTITPNIDILTEEPDNEDATTLNSKDITVNINKISLEKIFTELTFRSNTENDKHSSNTTMNKPSSANNFHAEEEQQNSSNQSSSSNIPTQSDLTNLLTTDTGRFIIETFDTDINTASGYFCGEPLKKRYFTTQINPSFIDDFSYLNRNKLVNRRVAIRKQMKASTGLVPISKTHPNYFKRSNKEFSLANPNLLNQQHLKQKSYSTIEKYYQLSKGSINRMHSMPNNNINNSLSELQIDNDRDFDRDLIYAENSLHTFKSLPIRLNSTQKLLTNKQITKKAQNENENLDTTTDQQPPKLFKINENMNSQSNFDSDLIVNPTKRVPPKTAPSSSIIIIERSKQPNSSLFKPQESTISDVTSELSPFSYHVPRRPPHERNAPMYTIGKRCFNERTGGGRTSWEKEWFNSTNPFTTKTDFNREVKWPSPSNYKIKSTISNSSSVPSLVYHQSPFHYIGMKLPSQSNTIIVNTTHRTLLTDDLLNNELTQTEIKSNKVISNDLDVMQAVNFIATSPPKISFSFRGKGTELWPQVEKTPGPGAYDHSKFKSVSKSRPNYTLPQARLQLNSSYPIGPYAAI